MPSDRRLRITDFSTNTFDLAGLQSSLCTIEDCFLCTRWHRNQLGVRETLLTSALGDHMISTNSYSWVAPYITTAMLVTSSDKVDNIHCMFCLDEEGDQVDERVILRAAQDVVPRAASAQPRPPWTLSTARRGTPRYEPQNAPEEPSRRFVTTQPLIWTPRSHGSISLGRENHLRQARRGDVAENPWRRAPYIVLTGYLGYRESLVTESSHAPSTRRRLARLGWVSKWLEELV
ncbi:hypothetical protein N7504_006257 [Penicillium tannophilum]|nr:hypothetical protein N7504_006257 [Penicillium tannophilum]